MDSLFFERSLAVISLFFITAFPDLTFTHLIPSQTSWWRKTALFIGMTLSCNMIIFIGDPVNILATLPIYFLCVWIGADAKPIAFLSVALIFFTIATSVSAMIDNLFFGSFKSLHTLFLKTPKSVYPPDFGYCLICLP